MGEPQPRAVEELSRQTMAAGVAVLRVAGERVADRREVGADLVGASSLEACLDQGIGGKRLEHHEVRSRSARTAAAHGPPGRCAVIAPERRVDRARS